MNTTKTLSLIVTATFSICLTLPVLADSKRIKYGKTGNIYQRIDTNLTWHEAKTACEEDGGYLATITTNGENNFIFKRLLVDAASFSQYKIGLTDEKMEGSWKWAVNEAFRYTNWDTSDGEPDGGTSQNYGFINTSTGQWYDITDTYTGGYICEWSAKQIKSNAVVSDLNGNGYDEWAIFYIHSLSQKQYVRIEDGNTGKKIQLIEIGSVGNTPAAITSLDDMSGNGKSEIATAYSDERNYWLEIHDAKTGDLIKKHYVLNAKKYDVISLSATSDSNGNGAPELVMQQEIVGSIYKPSLIQTMDAKSGSVLREVEF